jgi:F0F1-type ATP synthase delta subunit
MKTLKDFLSEQKEKPELAKPFIQQIKKYTNENNHFRARAYIATLMGNKRLAKLYDALEDLHDEYYSYFGNDVIDLRSKIEVNLKNDIKNYYSNGEEIIRAL